MTIRQKVKQAAKYFKMDSMQDLANDLWYEILILLETQDIKEISQITKTVNYLCAEFLFRCLQKKDIPIRIYEKYGFCFKHIKENSMEFPTFNYDLISDKCKIKTISIEKYNLYQIIKNIEKLKKKEACNTRQYIILKYLVNNQFIKLKSLRLNIDEIDTDAIPKDIKIEKLCLHNATPKSIINLHHIEGLKEIEIYGDDVLLLIDLPKLLNVSRIKRILFDTNSRFNVHLNQFVNLEILEIPYVLTRWIVNFDSDKLYKLKKIKFDETTSKGMALMFLNFPNLEYMDCRYFCQPDKDILKDHVIKIRKLKVYSFIEEEAIEDLYPKLQTLIYRAETISKYAWDFNLQNLIIYSRLYMPCKIVNVKHIVITLDFVKDTLLLRPDQAWMFSKLKTVVFNLQKFKLDKVYCQINQDFNDMYFNQDLDVRSYLYHNYRDLISSYDRKIIPYYYDSHGVWKTCWTIYDGNFSHGNCIDYLGDIQQFNSLVKFLENKIKIPAVKSFLKFE